MQPSSSNAVPTTLQHPAAARFWLVVLGTGAIAGLGAALLTRLLEIVQKFVWGGTGTDLLAASERVPASTHIVALLAAGAITALGQMILRRLSSGNGIDTTAAIWFYAGRMPALRTIGSAILSVIIVAMGTLSAARARPNRRRPWARISSPTGRVCPKNKGVWWWLAARVREWPAPTEFRWVARCSLWK